MNESFKIGQIVRSTKGKDCGTLYVVSALLGRDRLALFGGRFCVLHPKLKNCKHVQPTRYCVPDSMVGVIVEGKHVDQGRLHQIFLEFGLSRSFSGWGEDGEAG